MITGVFHEGSGIGNQLHRYVMTRVLALDRGCGWGMLNPELFKGHSFMKLDMGLTPQHLIAEYYEKKTVSEEGIDVRDYDWKGLAQLSDNTLVDGEWQGEEYFEHRLYEIREWLSVEPLSFSENICVINFRGGEYQYYPDLFLTIEYWNEAIARMVALRSDMIFQVHTDDEELARIFFPNYVIIADIGINWRAVRYAPYLILSNSSFAILPALLNQRVKKTIAPKYWARHNIGVQALSYNVYKSFDHT